MASKKKSLSDSAEAMTAALFGTSEKQEPEETKTKKVAVRKETKEEPKKAEKSTYGARISKDTITAWKAYIDASGKDAGACAEQALKDYMNNHKLTGIAKQIYDLKMQNVNK